MDIVIMQTNNDRDKNKNKFFYKQPRISDMFYFRF